MTVVIGGQHRITLPQRIEQGIGLRLRLNRHAGTDTEANRPIGTVLPRSCWNTRDWT